MSEKKIKIIFEIKYFLVFLYQADKFFRGNKAFAGSQKTVLFEYVHAQYH